MSFIGRTREKALLETAWKAGPSAFIPIYGRRRVGKSELILHFMENKGGIYFVGKRASGEAQLQEFLEAAARAVNEPLLAQTRFTGWKAALEATIERWKGKGKFILTLDEFQWMAEGSPELPSVLQELWDRKWSRSGTVVLILCGSYLGFMEREVLGKKSPLFGRRTAQIRLRPFEYREAGAFHSHFSVSDKARIYAICGGVPAYLLAFKGNLSVEQNIGQALLEDSGALAREPEFLLREELRDLVPYHAVLTALAQGNTNPAQIAKTTGIDVRALNYHLSVLIELGYVQRRYPVTQERRNFQSVRYALEDPLLRFWFRFVFPHQSLLRQMGPERGFQEIVRPELDSYFGVCFERLCREALPLIYDREGVRSEYEVGEYWDKKIQIDVVGLRKDNWTDLGECKWGGTPSVPALRSELRERATLFPNKRQATLALRFFTRQRVRATAEADEKWHCLDDLYEA